jgi:hypothetical protein
MARVKIGKAAVAPDQARWALTAMPSPPVAFCGTGTAWLSGDAGLPVLMVLHRPEGKSDSFPRISGTPSDPQSCPILVLGARQKKPEYRAQRIGGGLDTAGSVAGAAGAWLPGRRDTKGSPPAVCARGWQGRVVGCGSVIHPIKKATQHND